MRKSVKIMFHLIFWIISSMLMSLWLILPAFILGRPDFHDIFLGSLVILPIGAIIFYSSFFAFNYFARKATRFIWIAIGYIIVISIFIIKNNDIEFAGTILIFLFPVLYFNVLGFFFKTFVEWITDRKIKAELEKDKVKSQLELLKSQINPHFLFNTLNNIDVLIIDEPKKASDYLKKLSEILRFMLYETDTEKVPLSKEVEYIKKYIELQKIRTSNDTFVNFDIIGETKDRFVAPMIFIHFAENAFKYATNKKIENAISIRFDISENQLSFLCKNHINSTDIKKQENNGLGLRLIRQRLDLIYKADYNLKVSNEDGWYIVKLEIQLGDD